MNCIFGNEVPSIWKIFTNTSYLLVNNKNLIAFRKYYTKKKEKKNINLKWWKTFLEYMAVWKKNDYVRTLHRISSVWLFYKRVSIKDRNRLLLSKISKNKKAITVWCIFACFRSVWDFKCCVCLFVFFSRCFRFYYWPCDHRSLIRVCGLAILDLCTYWCILRYGFTNVFKLYNFN